MVRPGRSSLYAMDSGSSNLEPVSDLSVLFLSKLTPSVGSPNSRPTANILSDPSLITDGQIAQQLVQRLSKDLAYTRIGARAIISMRPPRFLSKFSESASKEHAEASKALPDEKSSSHPILADPHVFDISASAYAHMLSGTDDQCIILCGESGSGKSETHKMLIRNLCDLSKTSKKKSKVASNILKVDLVLSSFGNASAPQNPNASGFIRYTELQFNAQGHMVGMKLINHLLEKSRVSGPADGGLTFHIFYYLLEGASHEERVQWHLSDAAHFSYLSAKNRVPGYAQGKGATVLEDIRSNLKSLGIGRRQQTELWRLLAAVLHLGNITFSEGAKPGDPCMIRNYAQLTLVSEMLGVSPESLQSVLTFRSKHVGQDSISMFLGAEGAIRQRDYLARCLYSVAFEWLIEQINSHLCENDSLFERCLSILEIPGLTGQTIAGNGYHRLLVNFANEKLVSFMNEELFQVPKESFESQGLVFDVKYSSNRDIIDLLTAPKSGIISIVGRETTRSGMDDNVASKIYEANGDSGALVIARSNKQKYAFGIHHYGGIVEYDTRGFAELDADVLQSDFVTLVRGSPEHPGTTNVFLRTIFSDKLIATRTSARDGSTVISASNRTRFPSMKRRKSKAVEGDDEEETLDASNTVGYQFRDAISDLLDTVSQTQSWFVFHIRGTDSSNNAKIEKDVIERQVAAFQLLALAQNPAVLYTFALPHADFIERYKSVAPLYYDEAKSACESLYRYQRWTPADAQIGRTSILLAEKPWKMLENKLVAKRLEYEAQLAQEKEAKIAAVEETNPRESAEDSGSVYGSDAGSHYDSEYNLPRDEESGGTVNDSSTAAAEIEMGTTTKSAMMAHAAANKGKASAPFQPPLERPKTCVRKCWVGFSWSTTFCWAPFCLSTCGGMKNPDRQMAWREKVALCTIIFIMNAAMLFFIVGLGYVVCPRTNGLSAGQINGRGAAKQPYIRLYGNWYYIPNTYSSHVNKDGVSEAEGSTGYWENNIYGKNLNNMFPKTDWTSRCRVSKPASFLIDPVGYNSGGLYVHNPTTSASITNNLGTKRGSVVWAPANFIDAASENRKFLVAYDKVYEVTAFTTESNNPGMGFYLNSATFLQALRTYANSADNNDATVLFERLRNNRTGDGAGSSTNTGAQSWTNLFSCLDSQFYAGRVDHRADIQCTVPNYILLAASVILVMVIGFKFIAALQFNGRRQPEAHEKFVICQIPCYTEGEASLLRTINSVSTLDYDDKHKLIFIICDGMIIGSGNDRPTPRIVLDILGVDPSYEPETLAFQSLGEGNAQLNMAKVYSGLYEFEGHVVPYVVVVKVGKPSERSRPGNRGKRDSQLILMRYLSRVHYNQPMCPLELELYHQMKNVIGVDPSFYEFVFMVDADTQVMESSLNQLISHMVRDNRVSGTCGETSLANERKSFTTMIQVYEYFISHHMSKAFESLFGSVTCLPGCFCMYRIRTKNTPVLIAPGVLEDYSENTVDTLHLKNLLHLGEDRYLTTLIMKHFPAMKTTFTMDAKCQTYAPEKWSVLLSQRRRWINSTVHNLFELLSLSELCGFCCFSMRFIVFIDLLATFIQPSALLYIGYLVYAAISDTDLMSFPTISIIMIAAIYGFQIIILLLRVELQHIGWMIISMLATPLFGFVIPIYSFWHFDDFSWGNTRMAVEKKNADAHGAAAVEVFDPASIPLVKWADYEAARRQLEGAIDETMSFRSGFTSQSGYRPAPSVFSDTSYAHSQFGPPPSVTGGSVAGMPSAAYLHPAASGYPSLGRSIVSLGTQNQDRRASYMSIGSNMGPQMPVHIQSPPTIPEVPNVFPTDDELLREIKHILSTTDLMKVTKKSVREQLAGFYGVDLSSKKEYIHSCIDGVLRGEL